MFQSDSSVNLDSIKNQQHSFLIEKFDYIYLSVYTDNGEALVDPNKHFYSTHVSQTNNKQQVAIERPKYLIDQDGYTNLPKLGKVNLLGMTLAQADEYLASKYSETYFKSAFVTTTFANKRMTLLGAMGEFIIPLENMNTTLMEILAYTGTRIQSGANQRSTLDINPTTIRVIRGRLNEKPAMEIIDMSTIAGVQRAQMLYIMPNDIVYVEPRRKYDSRFLQDASTVVSTATGIITLIISIVILTR